MENEKNTSNFKIIPSVKEVKYLKKAIQSDNLCIQLTGVHIGNSEPAQSHMSSGWKDGYCKS